MKDDDQSLSAEDRHRGRSPASGGVGNDHGATVGSAWPSSDSWHCETVSISNVDRPNHTGWPQS
jgi:hypothetical protein